MCLIHVVLFHQNHWKKVDVERENVKKSEVRIKT